jgi:IS30 family transposase
MTYSQLTLDKRYQIHGLAQAGKSRGEIAREVGVDRTTVCREIRRNADEHGYRPLRAHAKAMERRRIVRRPSKLDPPMVEEIKKAIKTEQWSPEQIAGRRRVEGRPTVGKTRIYKLIWETDDAELHKCMRHGRKKRKAYGKAERRGGIPGRVGIEHRPQVVQERSRIGDWEGDTVVGRQEKARTIITLTERKSRFLVAATSKDRRACNVGGALMAALEPHKDRVHTLTLDNGREFAGHAFFSGVLEADVYFARPYHSWERGLNENTNGLLRQYFPKGASLKDLTEAHLQRVVDRLNNRPRKCLGYRTPAEVFFDPSG